MLEKIDSSPAIKWSAQLTRNIIVGERNTATVIVALAPAFAMMATWVIRVKAVTLLTFPTVDYVIPRNCAPMNVLMPESVIISLESVYAVIIEQAMIALSLNALPFMSFAPPATTTNASSVNKDGV